MVDGSLPDVEPNRTDVAIEGGRDDRVPAAPETPVGSRTRRRKSGIGFFKTLKRLWIPLVIVAVGVAGAMTVSRLHGIFGSDKPLSYADTQQEETKPFNPKIMRYEVFGPPGTVADVSYFDVNGDPVSETGVSLPWSLEFPITAAAGVGSIAAMGNSDSIGCRVLIDGALKDEKIATHEISTFTSCMLKAA